MIKLSSNKVKKAEEYIRTNCRPLEKARFDFLFNSGKSEAVNKELKKFQNSDGGFGNGLEPDFLLPDSSPLATSLAFQFINELHAQGKDMVKGVVHYLESCFVKDRQGWFAVSKEVNDYPHASWWNWDEKKKQTVIDASWGNPSAEIIGYLNKYRNHVTSLDLESLTEHAIKYWGNKREFSSEHEVYCYIRLYKCLPSKKAKRLEANLITATEKLVNFNPKSWKDYTPQPLHFANNPKLFLFETVEKGTSDNLDYLVNSVDANGIWSPNWNWNQYDEEWKKAVVSWQGIITIKNLKTLRAYGRTE